MSWLNLNDSLNSLKGQITNFATEVLSDASVGGVSSPEPGVESEDVHHQLRELTERCRLKDDEIERLRAERDALESRAAASHKQDGPTKKERHGRGEEEAWFWDPSPQQHLQPVDQPVDQQLHSEIAHLKKELEDERKSKDTEIQQLREENASLTTSLEDLDLQHQQATERLLTLKKDLQKNFEMLKKEHDDLNKANSMFLKEIDELKKIVSEKEKELIHVREASKSDYETLQHKYINLERVHSILQETTEKFQEENQELHEEVFKLQEELVKYDDAVVTNASIETVPKEKYDELLKEIEKLKENKNSEAVLPDEDTNIDDNAKRVIKNLKDDISDLKRKLENTTLSETHPNATGGVDIEKFVQLFKKYSNLIFNRDDGKTNDISNENDLILKFEKVFESLKDYKKQIDLINEEITFRDAEMKRLDYRVKELTDDNEFLAADLSNYSSELEEERRKNDDLVAEINALQNASKLQPIIESHEDNIVELEAELADCNKMNKSFKEEIETIKKNLSEVISEKVSLQSDLVDLRTKYNEMATELDSYKKMCEDNFELDLQSKYLKAEEKINKLQKELNKSKAENHKLGLDYSISQNEHVLLTEKINELTKQLEDKNMKVKKITVLENKLDHLEKRISEISKSKKEIELDRQVMIEKIRTLATEIDSPSSIESYNKTFQTSVQEVDQLMSQILLKLKHYIDQEIKLKSELEKTKDDSFDTITDLKTKSNELTNTLSELRKRNEDLLMSNKQLEINLKSSEEKLQKNWEEIENLTATLSSKDKELQVLQNEITSNKKISSDEHNQNMQVHMRRNQNLTIEIKTLKKQVDSLNSQINDYEREVETLNTQQKTKEEDINQVVSEKDNLLQKLNSQGEGIEKIRSLVSHQYKERKENGNFENEELEKRLNSEEDVVETVIEAMSYLLQNASKVPETSSNNDDLLEQLKADVEHKEKKLSVASNEIESLENSLKEISSSLETLNAEKIELVNFITVKHNENIQYHNEIQRLNQVILEHTNNYSKLTEEYEKLKHEIENCSECAKLKAAIKEKDDSMMTMQCSGKSFEAIKQELSNATDTIQVLTTKCEDFDRELTIQTELVNSLTAEKAQLSDREQNLSRELERLRRHLAESEEAHTKELVDAENNASQYRERLERTEREVQQRGVLYTSNSVRHQQQLDTLQTQLRLVEQQRDSLSAELALSQRELSACARAADGLHSVTAQLQHEKEHEVEQATLRLRGRERALAAENASLRAECDDMRARSERAAEGLRAAARLAEQLQQQTERANQYRLRVAALEESLSVAEARWSAASAQREKVDKTLVKNLLLNYLQAAERSGSDRLQVLRILSTVLDFNQQESERVGLTTCGRARVAHESLAREFVKFLEKESRPMPAAALPDMMSITSSMSGMSSMSHVSNVSDMSPAASSRSSTPQSRKTSVTGSPGIEATPAPPGHQRTPSGNVLLLPGPAEPMERSLLVAGQTETMERSMLVQQTPTTNRNNESAILKHVLRDM